MSNFQAISSAEVGFGLDVYQELALADPHSNLLFSPLSLLMALAMTLLGAHDRTASQMKTVLHMDKLPNDTIHQSMKLFSDQLFNTRGRNRLRIANRLYAEKTYSFLPNFTRSCQNYYRSGFQTLSFKDEPRKSELAINNWVEDVTDSKIRNLIPLRSITDLTKLILVNALHFKGKWTDKFFKYSTENKDFHVSDNETVNVPFMFKREELHYYYHTELDSQILELPFEANEASFIVILPDLSKTNMIKVEQTLSATILEGISNNLSNWLVTLWLPKFKIERNSDVIWAFKKLGMTDLFTQNSADLSQMNGNTELYITDVYHKAFVDVNEEGVEAAAATAFITGVGSSGPPFKPPPEVTFNADHPFIFFIKEKKTGAILFLGKVENPLS